MINDFRRSTLGLAPIGPVRRSADHGRRAGRSRCLYGFSRHVRSRYPPTPTPRPRHRLLVPGTERTPSWQPSPKLSAFLAGGEPPLYIGFGSMGFGGGAERRRDAVSERCTTSGARGVGRQDGTGRERVDLPNEILAIDQAPHDWLLPRMAAVVHHGGSGTTGAGLRPGKPT